MTSQILQLANLPATELARRLAAMTPEEKAAAFYKWRAWARPKQVEPEGDWVHWVLLSGRGFGKTRAGAEWCREKAEKPGPPTRGMIVSSTPGDARDVMVEGPSGIMSICPPWNKPLYEPSKLTLTWPNGTVAAIRSAHNPEALRGPEQHWAWCDELAAWPVDKGRAAWDNLMFGLRLGDLPRVCVTTTPKPIPLLLELVKDAKTAITKGSTYENAENLSPVFLSKILEKYEGTSLGRQEIHADILGEVEGALWTRALLEKCRVDRYPTTKIDDREYPDFERVVVAVDPPGGITECGIVAAGLGYDGRGYVLEDASLRGSTDEWARAVVTTFNRWQADRIVAEKNYGGDMVEAVIRSVAPNISYKGVTATRGKTIRAEPVAALSEQLKIKLVGSFPALEGELTSWVQGDPSPNRLDAMVWAFTDLMVGGPQEVVERELVIG